MQFRGGISLAKDRVDVLLDVIRLALFEEQECALIFGELFNFVGDDGVGNVEHIDRNFRIAINICKTKKLETTHDGVVQPTLRDDAKVFLSVGNHFVDFSILDELDRGWHTLIDLLLLVHKRCWW